MSVLMELLVVVFVTWGGWVTNRLFELTRTARATTMFGQATVDAIKALRKDSIKALSQIECDHIFDRRHISDGYGGRCEKCLVTWRAIYGTEPNTPPNEVEWAKEKDHK